MRSGVWMKSLTRLNQPVRSFDFQRITLFRFDSSSPQPLDALIRDSVLVLAKALQDLSQTVGMTPLPMRCWSSEDRMDQGAALLNYILAVSQPCTLRGVELWK